MIVAPLTDGRYRRIKDGAVITVLGCTGSDPISTVTCLGQRGRFHVQLGNFWKKYTEEESWQP